METLEFIPQDWGIFVLSITPYVPLIIGLIKQKDDSQTFLTWFLYCFLDCITMFSSKEEGPHGFVMAFGFAIGSMIMALILLYQKRYAKFSLIETVTIASIVICLVIWYFGGSHSALIASITSESIVGIYLILRTFKNPVVEYNLPGYFGFLTVSILTFLTAGTWTLATVGFAIAETILSLVILFPLLRKWWNEKSFIYMVSLSILLILYKKS